MTDAALNFVEAMGKKLLAIEIGFWELVLLFMLIMLYRLLTKAHTATDNNFDIKYLLIDDATDRVSLKKFGALVALIISSWIVLFMTVKGQMTEGILGLFLFVWAAVYVTPQTIAAWRQPPAAAPTNNGGGT